MCIKNFIVLLCPPTPLVISVLTLSTIDCGVKTDQIKLKTINFVFAVFMLSTWH